MFTLFLWNKLLFYKKQMHKKPGKINYALSSKISEVSSKNIKSTIPISLWSQKTCCKTPVQIFIFNNLVKGSTIFRKVVERTPSRYNCLESQVANISEQKLNIEYKCEFQLKITVFQLFMNKRRKDKRKK